MELKPYQQQVVDDLSTYLDFVQEYKDIRTAFMQFWQNHPRTPLNPTYGEIIEPYKNNIKGVPHVCIKVPTAGGKTFIASNSLRTIFNAFSQTKKKAVVWLVPSVTILNQTILNLQNSYHPYRKKINTHFNNRVEVYDKNGLLLGSNFNASTVEENLSIFVLSFDSLRAKKKEDRKVYQENGNLQSFEKSLNNDDEISLINVIQSLNPVVIVDESHNAETDLSIEMLTNLNPSFILDLTATPRKNSNIVSFVDAFELKKEHMVKLPVIVYNQNDKTEVIASAIKMQRKLEHEALLEEKAGGKYVRPIVLLQAQPKNKEDNATFEKIKDILLKCGIPEVQIKIKTASINEIQNLDLMSRDCEVRFIITINALKEGWDCPFAYILATLADKSSAVDVEQILGRILRQPYVSKHTSALLNMSYVLTASNKFNQTLENIVKGLNKAGFSSKDYKIANTPIDNAIDISANKNHSPIESLFQLGPVDNTVENSDDVNVEILAKAVRPTFNDPDVTDHTLSTMTSLALEQGQEMEELVKLNDGNHQFLIPPDLNNMVQSITVKEIFKDQLAKFKLPQFVLAGRSGGLFGDETIMIDRNLLIEQFPLEKKSIDIDFSATTSEMYKVDLDDSKKDNTPTYLKIEGSDKSKLMEYISAPSTTTNAKINALIFNVKNNMGNMYPIPDQRINGYLKRIFEAFDNDNYANFLDNIYTYSQRIKKKIHEEANNYARQEFKDWLDVDKIEMKSIYTLPTTINPLQSVDYLPKSLYEKEANMNNYEKSVISEIGNMDNILFWTRNIEKAGFKINGYINHFPDFIILTKKGNVILLETKGDHLEAENKIEIGNIWANKAGKGYKYFLVYNEREVKGAYRRTDFLEKMKEL